MKYDATTPMCDPESLASAESKFTALLGEVPHFPGANRIPMSKPVISIVLQGMNTASLNIANALLCNLKRIGVLDQVLLVAMDKGWVGFFADEPNLIVEYSKQFNKLTASIDKHTKVHAPNRIAKLL